MSVEITFDVLFKGRHNITRKRVFKSAYDALVYLTDHSRQEHWSYVIKDVVKGESDDIS